MGEFGHLRNHLENKVGLFLFPEGKTESIVGSKKILKKHDMCMYNEVMIRGNVK